MNVLQQFGKPQSSIIGTHDHAMEISVFSCFRVKQYIALKFSIVCTIKSKSITYP